MHQFREKWTALSRSLGFKIVMSVSLILMASYGVFIYMVLDIQQDFYFSRVIREADRFSSSVVKATRHSMLSDDPETTRSIVADLSTQAGISDIKVYNHEGIIRFSGQPTEVGRHVDKKAEACFACHAEDKPFSEVIGECRTRVYYHGGQRVLGMITPIYNEKSCYTAPCHAHPKEQRILGVLDVGMSLQGFDAHVRKLVTEIVALGLGTCAAVLVPIGFYVVIGIHRPVNRLREATKKLAVGDFSCKLPVDSTDEIGECARSFNIMRDQIRRRTQELMRSRGEYKALFDQVPCFICVINKDFEIIRQNSYMRDLFKGTIGMHCYEAFKKRPTKCEDCHAEDTFRNGAPSRREHCGLTVVGKEANYVSYTTPILDEKGEVLYAMIIAVDIEDRVQLAKELQVTKDFQTNLIENSIHGIVATDRHGRVTIFNRAAEALLGRQASDAIGDPDIEKYFPKNFLELVLAAHLGKPIEDPRMIAQETVVTSADGEQIPVRFSGVILFEKGTPIGSVGFFQDLRTFKKLVREKQESDRLAVVGQTVAGLAHGIKNVLTGLEGGVFVVQTGMEDGDKDLLERGWKMVQTNISRIAGLVKDLLSYSKERAPQYEETDPNVLAEEVCALFEIKAQEKSILIERQFDPEAGKMFKIFLDQRGIHTCLSNLVANALDACEMDRKPVQHRIVVRTEQDPDGDLVFEVSDNGVGMDEATKQRIFASFFSTKGSRGTGLGLLVTSKIVMEHGGKISFDSRQDVGTTFRIILPAVRAVGGDLRAGGLGGDSLFGPPGPQKETTND